MTRLVGAYRPLFATREARRLVAASLLARLPSGLIYLPVVLVAQQSSGSYAVAGAVAAAGGVGIAVTAPARGRLLDRHGARRVVPLMTAAHASLLVAFVPASVTGRAVVMIPVAFLVGAASPAYPAAMRLEWRRLLGAGDERLAQAYAFEAVAQIMVYVVGPLLAAACIALFSARAALPLAAALELAGGVAFAALAGARPDRDALAARRRDPIREAPLRTLVAATLIADVALGATDVAITAFAQQRDAAALAGTLLAVFTLSSAAGGALYGARHWATPAHRRLVGIMAVSALALLPLAAAGSLGVLAVLLVLAGPPYAAQWATMSLAVDRAAPAGTAAEAYQWLSTANAGGVAAGSALAGMLIEHSGTAAAFLSASIAVALAAATLGARQRVFQRPT